MGGRGVIFPGRHRGGVGQGVNVDAGNSYRQKLLTQAVHANHRRELEMLIGHWANKNITARSRLEAPHFSQKEFAADHNRKQPLMVRNTPKPKQRAALIWR